MVADSADRALVMRRGRMVERGEVVSLFFTPFTDCTRDLLAAVPRLQDVSITVCRGEVLGIVGESGSGKTTVARVASGRLPVSSGRVLLDDVDLSTVPIGTARGARQAGRRLPGPRDLTRSAAHRRRASASHCRFTGLLVPTTLPGVSPTCWSRCNCRRTTGTGSHPNCPADNVNGWRWLGRWRWIRCC